MVFLIHSPLATSYIAITSNKTVIMYAYVPSIYSCIIGNKLVMAKMLVNLQGFLYILDYACVCINFYICVVPMQLYVFESTRLKEYWAVSRVKVKLQYTQ